MVTRFVPEGYQPQWAGEATADLVRRAVEGGAVAAFKRGRRVGAIGISGLRGEEDDRIAREAIRKASLALE